jgi:hypothetical protein
MSSTIVLALIVAIFAVFAVGVGYAQLRTKGMAAPGARPVE